MTVNVAIDRVVCQVLDGIQSVATATDQITQILTNQLHIHSIVPAL